MTAEVEQHWTMDKRVPLALIITLVVQTFLAGWYVSALDQRLAAVESRVTESAPYASRLTRLETRLDGTNDLLREIRSDLRRALQPIEVGPRKR